MDTEHLGYVLQPFLMLVGVAVFWGILLMKDIAFNRVALLFLVPTGAVIIQVAWLVAYISDIFAHYRHNRLAGSGTAMEALAHCILRSFTSAIAPSIIGFVAILAIVGFDLSNAETVLSMMVTFLSFIFDIASVACLVAALIPSSSLVGNAIKVVHAVSGKDAAAFARGANGETKLEAPAIECAPCSSIPNAREAASALPRRKQKKNVKKITPEATGGSTAIETPQDYVECTVEVCDLPADPDVSDWHPNRS